MQIEVQVTQEDIDLGFARSPFDCPIARALKRAVGRRYTVTPTKVWETNTWSPEIDLPENAVAFIEAFDAEPRSPVAPFSFTLEVA